MKIKNSNVLITGGASGIGKIMGRMALEKGASAVIIWDINVRNIEIAVSELGRIGKVKAYVVDVSDNDAVTKAYEEVKKEFAWVDILINNAGIVTNNKTFDKQSAEEIIRMIDINTVAPMLVARAMLPDMLKRNCGHLVNVSSAAGTLSNPYMSVYTASKWGALGWSDSVRIEMQKMKSNVRVTSVAPYYINTGMFDGIKSKVFPILEPEWASRQIIKSIEKNRIFAGIPFGFHFIRMMQAILPFKIFDWIFGEIFGLYHVMDNFTGRK